MPDERVTKPSGDMKIGNNTVATFSTSGGGNDITLDGGWLLIMTWVPPIALDGYYESDDGRFRLISHCTNRGTDGNCTAWTWDFLMRRPDGGYEHIQSGTMG